MFDILKSHATFHSWKTLHLQISDNVLTLPIPFPMLNIKFNLIWRGVGCHCLCGITGPIIQCHRSWCNKVKCHQLDYIQHQGHLSENECACSQENVSNILYQHYQGSHMIWFIRVILLLPVHQQQICILITHTFMQIRPKM